MTTATSTTGRSTRSPAKHELMDDMFGREIGTVQISPQFTKAAWLDLCAGEGAGAGGQSWFRSCSPGILAYHARYVPPGRHPEDRAKPVTVDLYERATATSRKLVANLAPNMLELGYVREARNVWRHQGFHADVVYTVHDAPAHTASFEHVDSTTAVLLVNDPNTMHDWALPRELMKGLCDRTQWVLMMSTMGCNVGGLSMLSPEERAIWYKHIGVQMTAMASWHDLYIAAIRRDSQKWGYAITAPRVWRQQVEKQAVGAFAHQGYALDGAWLREDAPATMALLSRLFRTKAERIERGELW